MAYQVTAPLVQAKKADGSYVHVDEGGFLPDDIDPDQLKQLVDGEMVAEADPPADDGEAKPRRRKKS